MAKNLLNKYVWLVETIYKAKRITFEEINEKWLANDLSEGIENKMYFSIIKIVMKVTIFFYSIIFK